MSFNITNSVVNQPPPKTKFTHKTILGMFTTWIINHNFYSFAAAKRVIKWITGSNYFISSYTQQKKLLCREEIVSRVSRTHIFSATLNKKNCFSNVICLSCLKSVCVLRWRIERFENIVQFGSSITGQCLVNTRLPVPINISPSQGRPERRKL